MVRVDFTKKELEEAADFLNSALLGPSEGKTNEDIDAARSAMRKIIQALGGVNPPVRVLTYTCKCSGKVSGKLRAGAKTTTGTCEKCGDQYRLHAADAKTEVVA